jgi:hypothetical protein
MARPSVAPIRPARHNAFERLPGAARIRWIHVLIRREEHAVNAKRVYRLYRDMGLQLRSETPKRRVKARL